MKIFYGIVLLMVLSCGKNCVEPQNTACMDTPPTDELCEAYFNRWFYNNETEKCELIGYSGCNQYGFATEEECESCKCD